MDLSIRMTVPWAGRRTTWTPHSGNPRFGVWVSRAYQSSSGARMPPFARSFTSASLESSVSIPEPEFLPL